MDTCSICGLELLENLKADHEISHQFEELGVSEGPGKHMKMRMGFYVEEEKKPPARHYKKTSRLEKA